MKIIYISWDGEDDRSGIQGEDKKFGLGYIKCELLVRCSIGENEQAARWESSEKSSGLKLRMWRLVSFKAFANAVVMQSFKVRFSWVWCHMPVSYWGLRQGYQKTSAEDLAQWLF